MNSRAPGRRGGARRIAADAAPTALRAARPVAPEAR